MCCCPDTEKPLSVDAGYGLWLCPDEVGAARLSDLIDDLARRYGGPNFPPHITLLTHLASFHQAKSRAEACATTGPIECVLDRSDCGPPPFRAFSLLPKDPKPLLELHRLSEGGDYNSREYSPHLSLYYGYLDAERARRAQTELSALLPLAVRIDAVEVYSLRGSVEDWRRLGRFELLPRH